MTIRRLPRAVLAAGLALAGCGYSTRFALPPQYPSIGVELFGNDTPEPDLERDLHESLVRSMRTLLDCPLVAPDRARVVMRGKVVDYHRRSGIRSQDNVQLETGLTIRIEASLFDTVLEEPVTGPVTVGTQIGYTLDRRAVNESEARQRALDILAQRLVLELVSRSGRPREDGGDGDG